MIGLVRQKDGTILSQIYILSPSANVDSIIIRIRVAIAPIPAKAKCRKIVTV